MRNDTLVSNEMLSESLKEILKHKIVDTEHDIPYLAGYSENGKVIYIDRHVPKIINGVNVHDFLILHEAIEKSLLDSIGLKYQHAHQIALRAEEAAVRATNVSWHDYDREMQKYIKEAGSEKLEKLPKDLDIKPYRDEHDSELLRRMRDAGQVVHR